LNLPQPSQDRNQQARENIKIRGRERVKDAGLPTDSDGSSDKDSGSCGRGEACDPGSSAGIAERWSEGDEQGKGIDDDEYSDDDLDPDERELSGGVMLPVKMGNTTLNVQMDTAAQSVSDSQAWYRRHSGEPDPDSAGAIGADSLNSCA
jgi:hypothetical protein